MNEIIHSIVKEWPGEVMVVNGHKHIHVYTCIYVNPGKVC